MKNKNADILGKMTKDELVEWIREECFLRKPTLRWLLFHRWKKRAALVSKKADAHIKSRVLGLDIRDKYAAQFNATHDVDEKLRLCKLIEPYDKKVRLWIEEGRKIDDEQAEVDELYRQLERY